MVGVLGVLVGIFDAFVGLLGVLVGVLVGVLGVYMWRTLCIRFFRINFAQSSSFCVLCGKKVRQLEKSTPQPVVAVVTNMSYVHTAS